MEQFRSAVRRDALELALTVQRTDQDVQHQQQAIGRLRETLFDDVQERVKSLEERLRGVIDHEAHVNQTIDRNTHSQSASISAADIRKIVEELANRLDRSQTVSSAVQSGTSTNVLFEISDLKTKVLRLAERSTRHDGDLSFLTGASASSSIRPSLHLHTPTPPTIPAPPVPKAETPRVGEDTPSSRQFYTL